MSVQKKLGPLIPEESPIAWAMECFGYINKRFLQRNWKAAFVLSCALINQACKAFYESVPPWPMNFCLALTARQGTGKGLVKNTLKWLIQDTHVRVIGAGSPEGIVEQIRHNRFSFLIWDEAGESVEKGADYLKRNKYLLNAIHDLDEIGKNVVTRASTTVPAYSYYVTPILICLPEQWRRIEQEFSGGFERRFLEVRLQKFKGALETGELDERFIELAAKVGAVVNAFENYAILVHKLLTKEEELELSERIARIFGEDDESKAGEYFYKETVAVLLNELIAEYLVEDGDVSNVSNVSKLSESGLVTVETLGDTRIRIGDVWRHGDKRRHERAYSSNVSNNLETFIDLLCELISKEQVYADEAIQRLIPKLHELRKTHITLSTREFAKLLLGTTDSTRYGYVLRALRDLEEIRIYPYRRRKVVILDPQAPICANCRHFNKVCTRDYNLSRPEDRILAENWDPFQECKNDKFEPL
jgi:hypothetical protein